ncbi:MAG: hypothetical protein IAE67_06620 [Candidatus Competibacteraceae bacterium]|nr:hypothetical protein [Candidatus Competibacteraceae bacterium]
MLKDIQQPQVKDVAIAIIQEAGEDNELVWNVYILNLGNERIYGILITSRGYGNINKEQRESSVLRHFIEELPAQGFAKVEPIIEDLFELSNEYWVSYYKDKQIYDKKFIFPPNMITYENFVNIPLLGNKGVVVE